MHAIQGSKERMTFCMQSNFHNQRIKQMRIARKIKVGKPRLNIFQEKMFEIDLRNVYLRARK